MTTGLQDAVPVLSRELQLPAAGVSAVLGLLAEGCTVPFVARYRKEATGGLDEVQIRAIQDRHAYLRDLEDRRQTVLASIEQQGKLTVELKARILACTTKAELEDLYLPYKPKRRTRATIAREKGLEPLALRILEQPEGADVAAEAAAFVDADKGVESAEQALAGARDIVAELCSEDADVRARVREVFTSHGMVVCQVAPEAKEQRTKFEQYYDFREAVATIPSHRFLAVRRGEREGILRLRLEAESERVLPWLEQRYGVSPRSAFAGELKLALADAYERLLAPGLESDVRAELKLRSDNAAVDVFADNVRSVLMAAPLGDRPIVGVDPGLRTGCKCVALDATGKFLENITIYLTRGEAALARAAQELASFVRKHAPVAIAVGNGTGGRETEAFVRKTLAEEGLGGIVVVPVNEAGASIYSASDVAREEFPELDVTVRGAISIARRLQDPLAELVKIDPKSIGVGQYQHDVHQPLLARKLDEVVESCVNNVGVELQTASAPLLARVAGIGPTLAKKIVKHREEHGLFRCRHDLLQVAGLGPRTFQQAAGFIRVRGGTHPLDASAVHPERYELVERIAADIRVDLPSLVGDRELAGRIDIGRYISGDVGEPTLRDIVTELMKPGRDPRATFEPPRFRDDVHTLADLQPDMDFEGVVTNVTAFGAFVDIGVHHDGLVHISQLSDRFVRDPSEVVRPGDKLRVRVLEVDLERQRISLTARSGEARPHERRGTDKGKDKGGDSGKLSAPERGRGKERQQPPRFCNNPFADLAARRPRS